MNKQRLKIYITILLLLSFILYRKYRASEINRIFRRRSPALVAIYSNEDRDKDGNIKAQDLFTGFFINDDGLVLTVCHAYSFPKPEYVVEYLDKDDNPTTSTFISINGRASDELIVLAPTEDIRIKSHIELLENIDIKVGEKIYLLSCFKRRNYRKGNVFSARGIIPAKIISLLEYNLFAIDSLTFHEMSGSPILNKSGKLMGYLVTVNYQDPEPTETNVEYRLSDGTHVKIPYVKNITRYSIGRHLIWNNLYNWIKKVENDYKSIRDQTP